MKMCGAILNVCATGQREWHNLELFIPYREITHIHNTQWRRRRRNKQNETKKKTPNYN